MAIALYTTPSCGYCTMIKRYLQERKIGFTEYNVANDQRKADEMVRKSGQMGVPVIDINGTVIVGFDKNRLDQLLK